MITDTIINTCEETIFVNIDTDQSIAVTKQPILFEDVAGGSGIDDYPTHPVGIDVFKAKVFPLVLDIDCACKNSNVLCSTQWNPKELCKFLLMLMAGFLRDADQDYVCLKRATDCRNSMHIYFYNVFCTLSGYASVIKFIREAASTHAHLPSIILDIPDVIPLPFASKSNKTWAVASATKSLNELASVVLWPPAPGVTVLDADWIAGRTVAPERHAAIGTCVEERSSSRQHWTHKYLPEFSEGSTSDRTWTLFSSEPIVCRLTTDFASTRRARAAVKKRSRFQSEGVDGMQTFLEATYRHLEKSLWPVVEEAALDEENLSRLLESSTAAELILQVMKRFCEEFTGQSVSSTLSEFVSICSQKESGYAPHIFAGVVLATAQAWSALFDDYKFTMIIEAFAALIGCCSNPVLKKIALAPLSYGKDGSLCSADELLSTYGQDVEAILDMCIFVLNADTEVVDVFSESSLAASVSLLDAIFRSTFVFGGNRRQYVFDHQRSFIKREDHEQFKAIEARFRTAVQKLSRHQQDALIETAINQCPNHIENTALTFSNLFIPCYNRVFMTSCGMYVRAFPLLIFNKTLTIGPNPVVTTGMTVPPRGMSLQALNATLEDEFDFWESIIECLQTKWDDVVLLSVIIPSLIDLIQKQSFCVKSIGDSIGKAMTLIRIRKNVSSSIVAQGFYLPLLFKRLYQVRTKQLITVLAKLKELDFEWRTELFEKEFVPLSESMVTEPDDALLIDTLQNDVTIEDVDGDLPLWSFAGGEPYPLDVVYQAVVILCGLFAAGLLDSGEIAVEFTVPGYTAEKHDVERASVQDIIRQQTSRQNAAKRLRLSEGLKKKTISNMDGRFYLLWAFHLLLGIKEEMVPFMSPCIDLIYQLIVVSTYDFDKFFDFLNDLSFVFQPAHKRKPLILLSGATKTAKSTFTRLLEGALGTCHMSVRNALPNNDGSGPHPEKMFLNDAYLLTLKEAKRLDGDAIKGMTGGDTEHSRNHHDRDLTVINPKPLVLVVTNRALLPITNADSAVLARLRPYKLVVQFSEGSGNMLHDLFTKRFPQEHISETTLMAPLLTMLYTFLVRFANRTGSGLIKPEYRFGESLRYAVEIITANMPVLTFLKNLRYRLDPTKKTKVAASQLQDEAQTYIAQNAVRDMALPTTTSKQLKFDDAEAFIEILKRELPDFKSDDDCFYLRGTTEPEEEETNMQQFITVKHFRFDFSSTGYTSTVVAVRRLREVSPCQPLSPTVFYDLISEYLRSSGRRTLRGGMLVTWQLPHFDFELHNVAITIRSDAKRMSLEQLKKAIDVAVPINIHSRPRIVERTLREVQELFGEGVPEVSICWKHSLS